MLIFRKQKTIGTELIRKIKLKNKKCSNEYINNNIIANLERDCC